MAVLDFPAWCDSPAGTAAAVAGAFVAGAMAGSFLNVVAHRVPQRETVVFGRSHCPACGSTIRPLDNVPVLSWLALRGRCRDCRTPISARYPLVEAGCGCLAALLAAMEPAAAEPAVATTSWVGRTTVSLTLVAWALLVDRGHVISAVATSVAVTAAALAAAFVPALRPLPAWCPTPPGVWTTDWPGCLFASLTGIVAGWVVGVAGGGPSRAACSLVGAALGWQAALVAALAATGCRRLGGPAAAGPLAAVAAVICWHPLARWWEAMCRAGTGG